MQYLVPALILLAIGVAISHKHELKEFMAATKAELIAGLTEVKTALTKIGGETSGLVTKVAELETALGNIDNVPDDVMALVADIKSMTSAIDAQVTDATPEAPQEPTEGGEATDPTTQG